jgi:hypothetical protein
MSPKPVLLLLLWAVPFASLPQIGSAQGTEKEALKQIDQPLVVTADFSTTPAPECGSSQALVLQFHYLGDKPLRGYLIRLAIAGSANLKPVGQTFHEIRDSREQMIAPGADWTRTICS